MNNLSQFLLIQDILGNPSRQGKVWIYMEQRHPNQALKSVPSHQGWDLCWREHCLVNDQAGVCRCTGYQHNIPVSKFSNLSWHKETVLQSECVKFKSVHLFLTTMWHYIGFIFPNLFDIKQYSSSNRILQKLGISGEMGKNPFLNLHRLLYSKFLWDEVMMMAGKHYLDTSHDTVSGYFRYLT